MNDQIVIKKSDVIVVDDHRYVVEASQIGLRPGQAPASLLTTDVGNGCCFKYVDTDCSGEDTHGWRYRQLNSVNTLLVIND